MFGGRRRAMMMMTIMDGFDGYGSKRSFKNGEDATAYETTMRGGWFNR
jgi:hypothetical protein